MTDEERYKEYKNTNRGRLVFDDDIARYEYKMKKERAWMVAGIALAIIVTVLVFIFVTVSGTKARTPRKS